MANTKRLYGLFGLTSELLEAWKGQLREDLNIWTENGKVEARLWLTGPEAKEARAQLKTYNKEQPYGLQLVRI